MVAVDTETMGLHPDRDRLCLVQLSAGDGNAHLVQFAPGDYRRRPNLRRLLADPACSRCSISRASISPCCSAISGSTAAPVYCTKIASRLARTYTDRHGLKDLVRELLGIDLTRPSRARTGVRTS